LDVRFKPAFVEVIKALTTNEGGTLLNLINTKFNKFILTPESCAVNHKFIGRRYKKKKRAMILPTMIKIKVTGFSIFKF
jgi:hypothetical protein